MWRRGAGEGGQGAWKQEGRKAILGDIIQVAVLATGARFHRVLLGSMWNMPTWPSRRWRWRYLSPGVAPLAEGGPRNHNSLAVSSSAGAEAEQALPGVLRCLRHSANVAVWHSGCHLEMSCNLLGTVCPVLAEIRGETKQVCVGHHVCLVLHPHSVSRSFLPLGSVNIPILQTRGWVSERLSDLLKVRPLKWWTESWSENFFLQPVPLLSLVMHRRMWMKEVVRSVENYVCTLFTS